MLPSMPGGMGGQVYGCGFRLNSNTTLTIHCSHCGYTIWEQDILTTPGSYNRLNLGSILFEHGALHGFFACPWCKTGWVQPLQMVIRTKEAEAKVEVESPHSHSS